jgi:hypothetical protein
MVRQRGHGRILGFMKDRRTITPDRFRSGKVTTLFKCSKGRSSVAERLLVDPNEQGSGPSIGTLRQAK